MKGQLFRRYCTLDLCLVYTGIISPCLTDQSIHGSFSAPRVLHHKSVTLNEDRADGQPTCQPPSTPNVQSYSIAPYLPRIIRRNRLRVQA